jgi:hypothetical protein
VKNLDLKICATTNVTKVIWMLWLQGYDAAPEIVRVSHDNWKRMNPDYQVIMLDAKTSADFMPVEEHARIFSKEKPPEAISNEIRFALLNFHGGIWADATTLCIKPLDSWLPSHATKGFFAFERPGPDRMLSTWFLASSKANPAISAWRAASIDYWKGRTERHTYFWCHLLFASCYETDPQVRDIWDSIVKISAVHPFHFGPNAKALQSPISESLQQVLRESPAPVFKLTHKMTIWPDQNSLMQYLLKYALDNPAMPSSTCESPAIDRANTPRSGCDTSGLS